MTSVLLVALSQMSCSSNDPDDIPTGDNDQIGRVSFRIVAPKISRTSYSTSRGAFDGEWGPNYDQYIEFETRLLRDELHVVISDAECTQELELTDLSCTETSETASYVWYKYEGRVPKEQIEFLNTLSEGKLHILANAGYSAKLKTDPTFSRYGQPSDAFQAIPMWGVLKHDFSNIQPGTPHEVGEISLLRAMAKVEIDINSAVENNKIEQLKSVTVSTVNRVGHLLPDSWTTVDDTKNIHKEADVRIPENQLGNSAPMTFTFKEDNHVEFYLPEIRNSQDNEIRLTLTYVTDAGETTGDLYFRDYSFGRPESDPFNVQRNYIYSYKVSSNWDLEGVVDVIPFTSVEVTPDYGLGREEITGYIKGKDNKGNDCWYAVNYYESPDLSAIPYYLGPKDHRGEPVTINDIDYMLVYTDVDRIAKSLDHIFEKKDDSVEIHYLSLLGITGYEPVMDPNNPWLAYYLNDLKQRVWLDDFERDYCWYRTVNEWDRFDWSKRYFWGYQGEFYPQYWFDILGNRYPWSEGDTKEKRKEAISKKIGEDWIQYLED